MQPPSQYDIAKGPHVFSKEKGYAPAPPVEHREYPKWVDGKLVQSAPRQPEKK